MSVVTKIQTKVRRKPAGWCFTPKDFMELGSSSAVRQALSRLEKNNAIKRLSFGLYYCPIIHDALGPLPPDVQKLAAAIAKKDEHKIQLTGAYAANLLGLSDQVPNQKVFLTDGPSKTVRIGASFLVFKKTSIKNMKTAGSITGLIIQALKHIGANNFTEQMFEVLLSKLSADDTKVLKKQCHLTPEWIRQVILSLIEALDG